VHDDEMAVQHPPRDQCVYMVSLAQCWSALEDADPKVEVDCLGYRHEGAAVRAVGKEFTFGEKVARTAARSITRNL
jgi:hypothetical protein